MSARLYIYEKKRLSQIHSNPCSRYLSRISVLQTFCSAQIIDSCTRRTISLSIASDHSVSNNYRLNQHSHCSDKLHSVHALLRKPYNIFLITQSSRRLYGTTVYQLPRMNCVRFHAFRIIMINKAYHEMKYEVFLAHHRKSPD